MGPERRFLRPISSGRARHVLPTAAFPKARSHLTKTHSAKAMMFKLLIQLPRRPGKFQQQRDGEKSLRASYAQPSEPACGTWPEDRAFPPRAGPTS